MADNLLDKASILLTPTAYDNGSMLSIKPENGDGDFDFERNSAATRVNAQGLVENVQIISSELVSNKDFSQEGSELIVNGDFATDSDWSYNNPLDSIENGTFNAVDSSNTRLQQNFATPLVSGKTYRIEFTISNYVKGQIVPQLLGVTTGGVTAYSNGTFVDYIKATSNYTGFRFLLKINDGGFTGSIDNVSVKEVGQNWELDTGWSIDQANSKAVSDGTQGYIKQTNVGGAGVTSIYKAQWTQNITVGARLRFFARNYNDTGTITTLSITRDDGVAVDGGNCVGSGTFTAYLSSTNGYSFKILAETGVEADISNISVKEITDDTNIPRINYEGFSYQDSLGSELITNGNFSNGLTNWTNNSSWWSIVNGEAYHPASTSMKPLSQSVSTEVGKEYKISVNVNIVSGTPQVFWDKVSGQEAQSLSQGLNEVIVTTFKTNSAIYFGRVPSTNTEFYIDNVSVKEVTGQEVVPDSGCGSWLLEGQSTNLITYSSDFSQWSNANYTVQSNVGVSPSGNNDASSLTNPSGGGGFIKQNTNVAASTNYTFSFYAKKGTASDVKYSIFDNTNGVNIIASTSYYSQLNSSTFTRVTVSFTTPIGCTNIGAYILRDNIATGTVIVWGAQLEQQSFSTSYVPTSGAANTRLQDIANNSGNASLINSTEGVLYAEIAALETTSSGRTYITITDGTDNNRASILFSTAATNRIRTFLRVGGVTQVDFSDNVSDVTNFNKIAFSYKENDFKLYINGALVSSDTSGSVWSTNTINKLTFSKIGTTVGIFKGKVKALAVYKEALTDAELQSLTTQ